MAVPSCEALSDVLDGSSVSHVNLVSINVESIEKKALAGLDL